MLVATIVPLSVLAQEIDVPEGSQALANGFFVDGEWDDADRIRIEDRVGVYAKWHGDYLYIGIDTRDTVHTGIDLFLRDSAGNLTNFHASSSLGESHYADGEWNEGKTAQNRHWVANKIGLFIEDGEKAGSEPEGYEFQFERDLFAPGDLALAFRLKRPDYAFPREPEEPEPESWIQLNRDE